MIKIICSNETIEFSIKELLKIENNKISIKLYFEKVIKTVAPNSEYLDAMNNAQNLGNLLRVFRDKTYEINREFDLKNCVLLTSMK
ncbi:hypothetical protein [Mastigocoleus sp. MO_188.B34]|uniref:hypothetical protein n=1 Tax=Mastigocoleus sp. MO_188.B34 TaxID=3036635 RepID=UPI002606192D|nr:hypothetical protein [Mastigocoleus sp. MO_188.B34]